MTLTLPYLSLNLKKESTCYAQDDNGVGAGFQAPNLRYFSPQTPHPMKIRPHTAKLIATCAASR